MPLYLIAYDLTAPPTRYELLWERLRRLGGKEVLECAWLLRSAADAVTLRGLLKPFVGPDDRLFIAEVGTWAAWRVRLDINAEV